MIKTTHVRASLTDVLPILERVLAGEGLRPSQLKLEPRTVQIGSETMELAPEVPPNIRRIVVAAQDGWVAIADDPFASTEWGERLSAELAEEPVFTLEGECDHAFYSNVVVHRGGEEAHRSDVPKDAVHQADGRHRIRPVFLADYFPEARAALEAGIVVNKLGGEENVRAVGNAVGLPNATLTPYEREGDGSDAADRRELLFEYDAELGATAKDAGGSWLQEAFGLMMGDLAKNLTSEIDPEQLAAMGISPDDVAGDPQALTQAMMAKLGAMVSAGVAVQAEQPLSLEARSSSQESGFAGDPFECHTTFELAAGTAETRRRTKGAVVRVSGAGIAFFEVEKVRAMRASSLGDPAAPQWEVAAERGEDGSFVARFPEIELTLAEPAGPAEPTSHAERLRRRMHTPFMMDQAARDHEMLVYLQGRLVGVGKGELAITAEVTAADGQELRATSESGIAVEPPLRVPALPRWVTMESLRHQHHYLADYDGREWARGWLAFDRPWDSVREIVTRMTVDLAALLLEIGRSEKKERVELGRKASHAEIRAALARGAEVFVAGNPRMRATLDEHQPDTICLEHVEENEGSVAAGFSARVLCKGGEHIEFPAGIAVTAKPAAGTPWARILAELEKGADVTLSAGHWRRPIQVEIKHQPEGSNYYPDPERAAETVRVELSWSCPRPSQAASARSIGQMGTDLLTRAAGVEGQLGGVTLTAGSGMSTQFESPYEHLTETRLSAKKPAWLRDHVRSPGHRVLLPAGAAKRLGPSPLPAVEVRRLEHGTLLLTAGDDPFTAEREPIERAVLPLVERDPEEPTG